MSPAPRSSVKRANPPRSAAFDPVDASPTGGVELVATSVLESDTKKYNICENAVPSAAVELNVSECQPASTFAGIVTCVLTAPDTAMPDESVCGVERITMSYGADAARPCAVMTVVDPGIKPPTGTPSSTVADGATTELAPVAVHWAYSVALLVNG